MREPLVERRAYWRQEDRERIQRLLRQWERLLGEEEEAREQRPQYFLTDVKPVPCFSCDGSGVAYLLSEIDDSEYISYYCQACGDRWTVRTVNPLIRLAL
jgi:hypothetical protein